MTILFSIVTVLVLVFFFGIINSNQRFKKEVRQLFDQSGIISNTNFSYQQLSELPEPVQNYFKFALKEEQSYISFARIKHDGFFKTSQHKDWVNITGEQYFTVQKPGFIWRGKISLATAYDSYISDKGRLRVFLLNLLKVVDGHGESYNQGELLRWLGESFWFPTNLLPSERLKWSPIDSSVAKLSFSYKGLSLDYKVCFNDAFQVISIETQRFMDEKRKETWLGEFFDYQEINGIMIPTKIKASWLLKEGKYTYVDFHLKEIEYDKPKIF